MPRIFKVLLLSQESTTVQRYPNLWILLNMSQKKNRSKAWRYTPKNLNAKEAEAESQV